MFLVGPKKQCQNMFQPVRAKATTAYLACLAVTIFIVVWCVALDQETGLILGLGLILLLFVQCLCILWYTISCIPFLRDYIVRKLGGHHEENLPKPTDGIKGETSNSKPTGSTFGFLSRKRDDYEDILS